MRADDRQAVGRETHGDGVRVQRRNPEARERQPPGQLDILDLRDDPRRELVLREEGLHLVVDLAGRHWQDDRGTIQSAGKPAVRPCDRWHGGEDDGNLPDHVIGELPAVPLPNRDIGQDDVQPLLAQLGQEPLQGALLDADMG